MRALFAINDVPLKLGDGAEGFGLKIDGTLDVGASLGFVDALTNALPRFAFGVDLADGLALADRFYIRAETLLLHAEAHAADLDFGARLGFLTVGVLDGSVDLDANVEVDLTVLDTNANKKISWRKSPPFSTPRCRESALDGSLPSSRTGILPDATVGTVTFGAADIFDTDTYFFDFSGLDTDALNFGNIDAAGIVSLIGRLADELDNLRDSGFFGQIDIPFVNGAVDAVLGFADAFGPALDRRQTPRRRRQAGDDLNAARDAGLGASSSPRPGTHVLFQVSTPPSSA